MLDKPHYDNSDCSRPCESEACPRRAWESHESITGVPLVSRQAIVSLIGATTSTAGLKVYAELDENTYERAIKITDAQLAADNLDRDEFHGEWNHLIKPSR